MYTKLGKFQKEAIAFLQKQECRDTKFKKSYEISFYSIKFVSNDKIFIIIFIITFYYYNMFNNIIVYILTIVFKYN